MDRLDTILVDLRSFVAERDWAKFHDPKNLAMAVASEAGELLAEYRWIENREADAFSRDPGNRARIEAEAADVAITFLLFCERAGIELPAAIARKMEVNRRNYPAERVRGSAERFPR